MHLVELHCCKALYYGDCVQREKDKQQCKTLMTITETVIYTGAPLRRFRGGGGGYFYISIESFKLLLNEINQIENKNSFIIIREDALLSKGASNEETASQDLHLKFQVLFVTYTTIQRLYNQQWNESRVRSMDSANIEKTTQGK